MPPRSPGHSPFSCLFPPRALWEPAVTDGEEQRSLWDGRTDGWREEEEEEGQRGPWTQRGRTTLYLLFLRLRSFSSSFCRQHRVPPETPRVEEGATEEPHLGLGTRHPNWPTGPPRWSSLGRVGVTPIPSRACWRGQLDHGPTGGWQGQRWGGGSTLGGIGAGGMEMGERGRRRIGGLEEGARGMVDIGDRWGHPLLGHFMPQLGPSRSIFEGFQPNLGGMLTHHMTAPPPPPPQFLPGGGTGGSGAEGWHVPPPPAGVGPGRDTACAQGGFWGPCDVSCVLCVRRPPPPGAFPA